MAGLEFENEYYNKGCNIVVGVDEAGRGPLAGPLVVASCVLPKGYDNELIDDSKKLTEKKREELFALIKEIAVDYVIKVVDIETIDTKNIYQATKDAMKECVKELHVKVDAVLTDAMPLDNMGVEVQAIVKGDAKSQSIAAASILAKVTRDHIMYELDKKYPEYDFKSNKGYGTKKHIAALNEYGITDVHRRSYEPVKSMVNEQLQLDL